jgi:hypothetical protein
MYGDIHGHSYNFTASDLKMENKFWGNMLTKRFNILKGDKT